MCYAHGSIDQVVQVCPMCRVFPHPRYSPSPLPPPSSPPLPRCPHQRDICRNRELHPRIDVSYLKNAEGSSLLACYPAHSYPISSSRLFQWLWLLQGRRCPGLAPSSPHHILFQWARTNPPAQQAGYFNQGWPGCCRPPTTHEARSIIRPADWRSVSIIHQVPIPPEIKAAFDSLGMRGSPTPATARSPGVAPRVAAVPALDRRYGDLITPSKTSTLGRKSSISTKPRTSSPKQIYATLNPNLSRSVSATGISSSVPSSSAMEQYRRHASERRIDGVHSSQSSPKWKNIDLEASISPKRSSACRGPSVTPSTTSVSLSKVIADGRSQQPIQRRSTVSNTQVTPSKSSPMRVADRPAPTFPTRSGKKDDDTSSASSSSGSSDGIGSMSDSTVTSDGGFTDYLSDESEAELQRQAEARAALVAQNQAEELEFKAVRQQLAHIDLRPPKSWNPTNITTPRLSKEAPIAYPSRTNPLPVTPGAQA